MIWYSYKGVPYKGDCPAYYNLKNKGWFNELRTKQPIIKSLVLAYLQQEGIEVEKYFNQALVTGKENWKVAPFIFWGKPNKTNIAKGRDLYALFENISGLTGLSISILPPQTSVNPHYGDTDAVYRIHIPVKIPSPLPVCGLRVNGTDRSWETDELLAFCDAHKHEAWNHSNEIRIVLIADVVRKEYLGQEKNICRNVLSLLRLQQLMTAHKWLNSIPGPLKGALRILLKI